MYCSICRGLSDGSVCKERCIEHRRPGSDLWVEEAESVGESQIPIHNPSKSVALQYMLGEELIPSKERGGPLNNVLSG